MSRRRSSVLILVASMATPSESAAHLVNSGMGPFYDGALHLVLSPSDLLGLIAASLLAGLCGARAGRLAVLILPATWLAFGLVGMGVAIAPEESWLAVGSLVLLGAAVALDPRWPAPAIAVLVGLFGAWHGGANGAALAAIGAGPATLIGIAVTAMVVALLLASLVVWARADAARIAFRVVGSWIAAVGILLFGWLMRSGA